MFKPWNELSRNEQLHCEYYDFYKEVHGIRPRWIYNDGGVPANTEAEMEQMFQRLSEEADVVFAAEREAEQADIAKFEQRVEAIRSYLVPTATRATVIGYMFDAGNYNGDWDYMCFELGLPYGYLKDIYAKAA